MILEMELSSSFASPVISNTSAPHFPSSLEMYLLMITPETLCAFKVSDLIAKTSFLANDISCLACSSAETFVSNGFFFYSRCSFGGCSCRCFCFSSCGTFLL